MTARIADARRWRAGGARSAAARAGRASRGGRRAPRPARAATSDALTEPHARVGDGVRDVGDEVATRTPVAMTRITPIISAASRPSAALTASWPIPGQPNSDSVMTAPATRSGRMSPMIVMIGMSALRNAVAPEDAPRAEALRARGHDVLAAHHLEQRGARVARRPARRWRRPSSVTGMIRWRARSTGSKGLPQGHHAARRQDLEVRPEDVDEHEPDDEARDRDERRREAGGEVVEGRVLADRREHAERRCRRGCPTRAAVPISSSVGPRRAVRSSATTPLVHDGVAQVALERCRPTRST